MASGRVKVVVMAPHLGSDLRFVGDVDERIESVDGNRAFRAELVEQGRGSWSDAGQMRPRGENGIGCWPRRRSFCSGSRYCHE